MNTIQLKNDRLMRAIRHQTVDAIPVWLMRQAGRYLPEYRQTRAKAGSFMTLCKTPELACEVTLQPLNRFDLDAAIIFSDILTIPDAMGLGLSFIEGVGPVFDHPLHRATTIDALHVPEIESLSYVYEAIRLVQNELSGKVPLIGFCGSPWTLAAYMIEGRSKPGFPYAMKMLTEQPSLLHSLLDTLKSAIMMHLSEQIRAGVQVVMIFDTWGGILNTANYQEFSLHYIAKIIKELQLSFDHHIPIILFTKGGHHWLADMEQTECDVLGIDSQISLPQARAHISKVALQGNLDPTYLLKDAVTVQNEVEKIIHSNHKNSGYIFNLGHGVLPETPIKNVEVLVNTVHELSRNFSQDQKMS